MTITTTPHLHNLLRQQLQNYPRKLTLLLHAILRIIHSKRRDPPTETVLAAQTHGARPQTAVVVRRERLKRTLLALRLRLILCRQRRHGLLTVGLVFRCFIRNRTRRMGPRLNDACRRHWRTRGRLVGTPRMGSTHLSLRYNTHHAGTFTGGRLRSTAASALSVTRSYFMPNSFFWKYFCACVRI